MNAATFILSVKHPGLFLLGIGVALIGVGIGLKP